MGRTEAKTGGDVVRVDDPGGIDGFFKISARGSTLRTEILAGVATWLTMDRDMSSLTLFLMR